MQGPTNVKKQHTNNSTKICDKNHSMLHVNFYDKFHGYKNSKL